MESSPKGNMNTLETDKRAYAFTPRESRKPIHFYFYAPQASQVEIEGEFTGWKKEPMERRPDGWWCLTASLGPGHHKYRLLVNGRPALDPRAQGVARNEQNEKVSLLAVS